MSEKNFCRLCFQENANCKSLFEKESVKMLQSLTNMKINPQEKTSMSVCPKCVGDLETAYNIQQKFIKAELVHEEELLADFLIENHEELKEDLFIHNELNSLQLDDTEKRDIDSEVVCEVCFEKFACSKDMLKHVGQHSTCNKEVTGGTFIHQTEVFDTDILCEKCAGVFEDMEAHNIHMKTVHIGKHICDICGADFSKSDFLQQHIKAQHSNLKSFHCDTCNETFSLRYLLQLHKIQHIHEGPHACEFCPRKFKHTCTLKIHLLTTHDKLECVRSKPSL